MDSHMPHFSAADSAPPLPLPPPPPPPPVTTYTLQEPVDYNTAALVQDDYWGNTLLCDSSETCEAQWDASSTFEFSPSFLSPPQPLWNEEAGQELSGASGLDHEGANGVELGATELQLEVPPPQQGDDLLAVQFFQALLSDYDNSAASSTFTFEQAAQVTQVPSTPQPCAPGVPHSCQPLPPGNSATIQQIITQVLHKTTRRIPLKADGGPKSPASVGTVHQAPSPHSITEKKRRDIQKQLIADIGQLLPPSPSRKKAKTAILEHTVAHIMEQQKLNGELKGDIRRLEEAVRRRQLGGA